MAAAVTTAGAIPNNADADRIDPRRLITFLCMVFGMFMAILDIQIVSASLTEIQAGLAASSNEISWVQTAYLIAEVVMIPLSGFLSRALGTRVLFAISAAVIWAKSFYSSTSRSETVKRASSSISCFSRSIFSAPWNSASSTRCDACGSLASAGAPVISGDIMAISRSR